jgi:uncharacterized membrane protein YoaK (UPF0700 family)
MISRTFMGGEAYIHARMVALALVAGCVDAAAFLGLDGVFVANQTGNTVLLGIAAGRGEWEQVARAGDALGMFCVGVAVAAVLLRGAPAGWPGRVTLLVALEAVLVGALVLLWHPLPSAVLIAFAGAAMGIQSAATQHAGVPGVTTTFVTGTLTRIFSELGGRPRAFPERTAALAWLAYLLGALAGGLVERAAGSRTAMLLAAVVLAAISLSAWRPGGPRSRPTR